MRGRSDDMIVLRGVNIFPIQVEKILMKFPELSSDFLIKLVTLENGDFMSIDVELSDLTTDDYPTLVALNKEITHQLKDEILVTPKVNFVKKGTLGASDEKKAVRVLDLRKQF
jgi:phenylacetate-CoA ligase